MTRHDLSFVNDLLHVIFGRFGSSVKLVLVKSARVFTIQVEERSILAQHLDHQTFSCILMKFQLLSPAFDIDVC